MNSKNQKTLELIFAEPINGNIAWRKIEALFLTLGQFVRRGLAQPSASF